MTNRFVHEKHRLTVEADARIPRRICLNAVLVDSPDSTCVNLIALLNVLDQNLGREDRPRTRQWAVELENRGRTVMRSLTASGSELTSALSPGQTFHGEL